MEVTVNMFLTPQSVNVSQCLCTAIPVRPLGHPPIKLRMELYIWVSIIHDSSIIIPSSKGDYIPFCGQHEFFWVYNKREVLKIIREHLRLGHHLGIRANYGELTGQLLVSPDCAVFIRTDTDPQGNRLPEKAS